MKKHLIAAAVAAAVATPAMAQLSITGVLDVRGYHSSDVTTTGVSVKNIGGNSATGGSSATTALDGYSTSAMTFAATEDLGGGLKASAVWVQRMSATTYAERERYIDLAGGFGSVRFGRFNPTISGAYNTVSGLPTTGNAGSFYNFVTDGGSTTLSASAATFASGNFERQDNLLQYTAPKFGALTLAVGYANSSNDDGAVNGKDKTTQTYGTINYGAGPLEVVVGLGKRDLDVEAATPVANKSDLQYLGAAYNFGVAKLHVTQGKRDQKIAGAEVHDLELTTFAFSVPVGATAFRVAMYEGKDNGTGANRVKLDGYQAAVTHALSKRTFIYAVTGVNDKKRDGTSTATETETKQTGIGVSHSF